MGDLVAALSATMTATHRPGEPVGINYLAWQGSSARSTFLCSALPALQSMGFDVFSFYTLTLEWLLLVCGDVESNPRPARPSDVRILYANIRGLAANLDELTVTSVDFDVLCLSETLVSDRRHPSELHISGFNGPQQRLAVTGGSRGLRFGFVHQVWLYGIQAVKI